MKSNEQRRKSEKAQRQAGRLILQTRDGRADEREADAARAALALQALSNRKTAGPRNAALRRKKRLRTEMQTEKCFRSQLSEARGRTHVPERGRRPRPRPLSRKQRTNSKESAGASQGRKRGEPGQARAVGARPSSSPQGPTDQAGNTGAGAPCCPAGVAKRRIA